MTFDNEKLCQLMKEHGVTNETLGFEIGVATPNVSNWRRGKSVPSPENLKKLVDFFGCDEGLMKV